MHSQLLLGVGVLGLGGAAAMAAPLPLVGVQFTGSNSQNLDPSASAGVYPQANYNQVNFNALNATSVDNASPIALSDFTGSSTPITLSATALNNPTPTYSYLSGSYANPGMTSNDDILLNDQNKNFYGTTYSLGGLDPSIAYTIVLYSVNDQTSDNNNNQQDDSIGSTHFIFDSQQGSSFYGTYTVATNSTTATLNVANYVEFDNITAPSGTLQFTVSGNGNNGINGFQVLVPEPASCGLAAVGFGALSLRRRRA